MRELEGNRVVGRIGNPAGLTRTDCQSVLPMAVGTGRTTMDGGATICGTRVQRGGSFMGFQTRTEIRATSGGQDGAVYVLENDTGSARAEIWPAGGFNCHRWQVTSDGKPLELLYSDPQFFHGAKPTRSGIPVLFPFPNRIRDGRFTWAGKEYRLPLHDPSGKNAIHGFACH